MPRFISDILKELAEEIHSRGIKRFSLTVRTRRGKVLLRSSEDHVVVVGDGRNSRAESQDPTLTPNERRVLGAVKPIIQSAKQIAHEAGYERASGQLYATLRTLAEKGLVERAPGGGFRAKGEFPENSEGFQ